MMKFTKKNKLKMIELAIEKMKESNGYEYMCGAVSSAVNDMGGDYMTSADLLTKFKELDAYRPKGVVKGWPFYFPTTEECKDINTWRAKQLKKRINILKKIQQELKSK